MHSLGRSFLRGYVEYGIMLSRSVPKEKRDRSSMRSKREKGQVFYEKGEQGQVFYAAREENRDRSVMM